MTTRAVPFYCPYCGEEDLEPQGAADGEWHCRGHPEYGVRALMQAQERSR